jgi:hypothetical protein
MLRNNGDLFMTSQVLDSSLTWEKLAAAIGIIGSVAAALQGVSWSTLEAINGWRFGAGGYQAMPSGTQAVALSLTVTIPLVISLNAYQFLTGQKIIPISNWATSSAVMVLGGVLGHLIMYGTRAPHLLGLKEYIYPVADLHVSVYRAVGAEFSYALVYFPLIVGGYLVFSDHTLTNSLLAKKLLVSGTTWFALMAGCIVVIFPRSIQDSTFVQVRGFFSAWILQLCFVTGLAIR